MKPFKVGDFVALATRHGNRSPFRGVVVDAWKSPLGGWSATVLWENGRTAPAVQGRDLKPFEPFPLNRAMRDTLEGMQRQGEATIEKVTLRLEWIRSVLGAS